MELPVLDSTVIRFVTVAASISIGCFLWRSAYQKLLRPRSFIVAASSYKPLTTQGGRFVGLVVPIAELVTGTALVLELYVRVAAIIAAVLFAVFAVGISYNLALKNVIVCGCAGGTGNRMISVGLAAKDGILIVVATVLAVAAGSWRAVPAWSPLARIFAQPVLTAIALGLVLTASGTAFVLLFGRGESDGRGVIATWRIAKVHTTQGKRDNVYP